MEQILTWSLLIMSGFSVYRKIMNISNQDVVQTVCGLVLSVVLTFGVSALKTPMPYTRFVAMTAVIGAVAGIMTNTRFDLALTGIMIALGIGTGIAIISACVLGAILWLAFRSINQLLLVSLLYIAQPALIALIFRIKRFKKGMLFLKNPRTGVVGAIISAAILAVVVLIGRGSINEILGIFVIIAIILCLAGLIIWWRNGLSNQLRERMRENNARQYEATIAALREDLRIHKESNEFLETMLHRDNKLLPSMLHAVRSVVNNETADLADALDLMARIEQLAQERTDAITQNQLKRKSLTKTGDLILDGLMNHMMAKASQYGILFDLQVYADRSEIPVLHTEKFETLCADLIENAIIATSHCDYKMVLVVFQTDDDIFELVIHDSGIPFEPDTFQNLGQKRASTHLEDGGSGIGYMTVFEILREVNASLIITEHEPKPSGFTKSVKVRFDGRGEYLVIPHSATGDD